jgi:inhibitor of cysteine peptidase
MVLCRQSDERRRRKQMQARTSTVAVPRPVKPATVLLVLATIAAVGAGVIALTHSGETTATSVALGPADGGSAVALDVGGELTITLPANPSTGYSWVVTAMNTARLTLVGEPEFSAESNLIGAGGTITYRFRGAAAGQDSLQLDYVRPWEDTDPLETYVLTINVR